MTTDTPTRLGASVHDAVSLRFPARPEFMVLARLSAAAVASRASFSVDDIEDLRIAVDELCLLVMDARSESDLIVDFELFADHITITARIDAVNESDDNEDDHELSEQILSVVADDHGVTRDPLRRSAWLTKRPSEELS